VYFNPGTAHDVVQALNARDGSYRWTFTIRTGGPGMGVADPPGLAAAPGYVYVTFDRPVLPAGWRRRQGVEPPFPVHY
jgi:hypothetical protein